MIPKYRLLFLSLLAASCFPGPGAVPPYDADRSRTVVIPVELHDGPLRFDSLVRSHTFTPLETHEGCMVGAVDRLFRRDSSVWLLDRRMSKALYVFGADGRFCRMIGRQGRGPGEYVEPTDFALTASGATVLDMFGRRLLHYAPDGTWRGSSPLNCILYEIAADPAGAGFYAVGGDNRRCDSLRGYEILGLDSVGGVRFRCCADVFTMNFSNGCELQTFGGGMVYRKALRPEVCSLHGRRVETRYRFDIASSPLPDDCERLCRGDFGRFIERYRDDHTWFNGRFWETDRYVGAGFTSRRTDYLLIYDKQTGRTVSGWAGITYGLRGEDTDGYLTAVLSGPVDVTGSRITGLIDAHCLARRPSSSSSSGASDEPLGANPVLVTVELRPADPSGK